MTLNGLMAVIMRTDALSTNWLKQTHTVYSKNIVQRIYFFGNI